MSDARAVAEALAEQLGGGIRKSGRGWIVRCPCHQDKTPSLSIANGDRAILFYCHAGCRPADVLANLIGRGLLPDHHAQQRGRRPHINQDQIRLARTTLAIWDRDRVRGLPITKEDEAARAGARKVLALTKKSPPRPHTPVPWVIRLTEGEVRIDVGEACRGLPGARHEPLVVHWPAEIEAALVIDQVAPAEVLEWFARHCLRAGARVVRVISDGRMDVYRAEVGHA